MSVSRAVIFISAAIMSIAMAVVLSLSSTSVSAQSGTRYAATPFTFKKLFEDRRVILEHDPKTKTAVVDKDGDTLIAGIFRVTDKNPVPNEGSVFVMMVVAVCGYNGVIIAHSKNFDSTGKFLDNTTQFEPMQSKPGTAVEASYNALCGSGVKPTPIAPSNKAPERYTRFWV